MRDWKIAAPRLILTRPDAACHTRRTSMPAEWKRGACKFILTRRVATYGGRRFWIIVSSPGENANSNSGANFISGINLSDCSTHSRVLANSVSTFEQERYISANPIAANRNFHLCLRSRKRSFWSIILWHVCAAVCVLLTDLELFKHKLKIYFIFHFKSVATRLYLDI